MMARFTNSCLKKWESQDQIKKILEQDLNIMTKHIVDLSVPFHKGMPKYEAPWFPEFDFEEVKPASMPEAQWKRRFTSLKLFAHNGTHVETSDHVFSDGKTIDSYELEQFFGKPFIVDLQHVPDSHAITGEQMSEALAGYDPNVYSIVLVNTGYNDRHWGEEGFWGNSPYMTQEAAQEIANLKPQFVGIDFQTEKPGEKNFVVHKTLLSSCNLLCEYLFNLGSISDKAWFFALPISIKNVEASPVRAVAIEF
jgi:kynurenine formamidase